MRRHARARIDLSALRHNLARVRAAAPDARVMAAIKADGYGHGMLRVAEALHAADGFALACVGEGVALRDAGFAHPIVLLQGVRDADELRTAAEKGIGICVHQPHHIKLLETTVLKKPVKVWLKIDTGMHRLGIPPEEAGATFRALANNPNVAGKPCLMTHFARADEEGDSTTRDQIAVFDRAVEGLDGKQSLANSAGILAWPDSHRDWVRPGIMLYGGSPFAHIPARELDLRPAMTLTAPLIAIRELKQGDPVGYGGTWNCPEDMRVGAVAIGYGDGYPRHAPSGTPVAVRGQRTQLVGRVSMDVVTIDLRGIEAQIGDAVELWGGQVPMDEVAIAAGTISYELTCSVGPFVHITVDAGNP
jgi:alanine racemase